MNKLVTNQLKQYFQQYFELFFWMGSLVLLFFMQQGTTAPTLCIFKRLDISWCPGCGLGHSISDALHLQFVSSFKHHPLGIAAVLIILNRIKQLSFKPKYVIQ
jgi:hypothetical protein